MDTAFILVERCEYPDPAAVVASAKGLGLVLEDRTTDSRAQEYGFGDGQTLRVMLIDAKYPGAWDRVSGPTAARAEDAAAAAGHVILGVDGLTGPALDRDPTLAALCAAVIDNVPAVGAKLGHGVVFHRADLFSRMAAFGAEQGKLPSELAVDITVSPVSRKAVSVLTHNLPRYGRENFYVTCSIKSTDAMGFVMGLAGWVLEDPSKQFATGDTIGRTATEKIRVQRVPSPIHTGETVIRLDLP